MSERKRGDAMNQTVQSTNDGDLHGKTKRKKKIINLIVNTSIILMSTLMGGLTEAMMNLTGSLASGVAGVVGGEEAGERVSQEFKQKLPEIDDKMKTMIADVRKDMYVQIEQKKKEIEPYLSDPAFDVGPRKIDDYDFSLPKLTEELDDSTIAQYTYLLVSEDQKFAELFTELTNWMKTLPMPPSKTQLKTPPENVKQNL